MPRPSLLERSAASRAQSVAARLYATVLFLATAPWASAEPPALTFFGWSDQHVQTNGDAEHLLPAIDAMNRLPETPYPESVGGKVESPAFVFGCGDITEWPARAAIDRYEELLTHRLKFPAYDVIGNHDEGGTSPVDTVKQWLTRRHGGLTYSFTVQGIRFVALLLTLRREPAEPGATLDAFGAGRTRRAIGPIAS